MRSKYGTSLWVSDKPRSHNPSRGPHRSDHFIQYYQAFQERADRVRTNIRGRTLRATLRTDITDLSAPLEIEVSSGRMGGGSVSSRMADARAVSARGTAAWRAMRKARRPDRW